MQRRTIRGNLMLLLAAVIWGAAFVSQRVGMELIGPNTFNGLRTLLGAAVLTPFILIRNKTGKSRPCSRKTLLLGGVLCGVLLCAASTVQTWGLIYTTSGKSGFITAMYMLFVPIIGLFLGKRLRIVTVLGIACGAAGLYLLTLAGTALTVNFGDFLTLICAVVFAFHILAVDYLSDRVDGVKLSCLQFLVCGVINVVLMLLLEKPDWGLIVACTVPILYSGCLSCGVAYTLQIVGQQYTDPVPASIIMSLESVFAVLSGWLLLKEALSPWELLGCVLMFAAIIIVQLPVKETSN